MMFNQYPSCQVTGVYSLFSGANQEHEEQEFTLFGLAALSPSLNLCLAKQFDWLILISGNHQIIYYLLKLNIS